MNFRYKNNSCLHFELKALLTLSAIIISLGAYAQDGRQLEEILVIAQKRVEPLQDVPVSVSVLDGEKIRNSGAQRLHDLSGYVPNFSLQSTPIGDLINTRGIQSGSQAGFEQSVSTFVDNVYRGRSIQSRYALLDVDMLEFLRGPQVILFGKNTIAGVMNIRSRQPTTDYTAELSLTYTGEFDETELSGFVSGPITNNFRGRLAFLDIKEDQGWVKNSFYNQDSPTSDESAARLTLEWDLADSTTAIFRHEYGEWDSTGGPWITLEAGPQAAFGVTGGIGYTSVMGNNADITADFTNTPVQLWGNSEPIDFGSVGAFSGDSSESSLNFEHTLNNEDTINVIFSNSEYNFKRFLDADFGPLPTVRFDDSEDFDQESVEFRYTSKSGESLEYLFGGYWQQSKLVADGLSYFSAIPLGGLLNGACAAGGGVVPAFSGTDLNGNGAPDPFDALLESIFTNAAIGSSGATANACGQSSLLQLLPALDGVNRYSQLTQDTDIWALFGQASFSISDNIRASLGLRYTEDRKTADKVAYASAYLAQNSLASLDADVTALGTVVGEFTPHNFQGIKRKESDFSWSANVQFDVSVDAMIYATASTGAKAGGFNTFYFGDIAGGGANPEDVDFEGEDVLAFEVGAKLSLFSGVAELNIAAFHTSYDDLQAAVFTGGTTFVVQNAAEATSKGIEIDSRWRATDRLEFQASFSWVDFEYDKFPNQACTISQLQSFRETAWAGGANPLAALANNSTCSAAGINDLAGRTSYNTPEFKWSLVSTYRRSIGNYELSSSVDINWQDELFRAPDLDPVTAVDAYAKVNAVLTFGPQEGSWDISIIGRNLTDEEQIYYADDTPLFSGTYQAAMQKPRSLAIRARIRY